MESTNSALYNENFTDYAIGNGVFISTMFGSGIYYSYPDRIKLLKKINNNNTISAKFSDNKMGIYHILPTFWSGKWRKKE